MGGHEVVPGVFAVFLFVEWQLPVWIMEDLPQAYSGVAVLSEVPRQRDYLGALAGAVVRVRHSAEVWADSPNSGRVWVSSQEEGGS